MGPNETRALEILLAMSRGRTLADIVTDGGWKDAANIAREWGMVTDQGTLTVKGQDFIRLTKDEAALRVKYCK